MKRRPGFTLVELMTVIVLVGGLAAIALPHMATANRRAEAASIVHDFTTVRLAAALRFVETDTYPETAAAGVVPPELVTYLPDGFEFQSAGGAVLYRWRRWGLPIGRTQDESQTVLVGLEITTENEELMAAIQNAYSGSQAFGTQTKVVFIIL